MLDLYAQVACDVPIWATIGGQDVDRLPSASTCYNTLKVFNTITLSFLFVIAVATIQ